MKVWALWSARVDMYSQPELIELFADPETAETARVNLIGKQSRRDAPWAWQDDEDFPDLYVREVEIWVP